MSLLPVSSKAFFTPGNQCLSYVKEFETSIYREIQEHSRKTINIQFRLKILILKFLFWKADVTLPVLGMSKLTI